MRPMTGIGLEWYKCRRRQVPLVCLGLLGAQMVWMGVFLLRQEQEDLAQGWMLLLYNLALVDAIMLPLTVAVMTDYTCIPFWEETDCDYYVMSHEALRKSCVKRGIPEEKLLPFGIPVSRACRKNTPKAEARKKLGLKQDGKYFLAAGGSMGAGDLDELIGELLARTEEEEIIAICGSNQKAEQ